MVEVSKQLLAAWTWRQKRGLFHPDGALRIFHGPGEGEGGAARFSVDRFGDHYWITSWEKNEGIGGDRQILAGIVEFLRSQGALSAVELRRPEKGLPEEPVPCLGDPPSAAFSVREGQALFSIRMQGARHPGLFLDHAPLRAWLATHAEGWKTLNTFSYTGSLSVAAALGGASQVVSLDLARSATEWAKENWKLNGLEDSRARFIAGDVFEWLPRLRREGAKFDCVILDPPSFSRGKKGSFSTSKDLVRLHELAMDLLAPEGFLVTSINSAQVPVSKYERDVKAAAASRKMDFEIERVIELPETFPTRAAAPETRYLKGWILKRRDRSS